MCLHVGLCFTLDVRQVIVPDKPHHMAACHARQGAQSQTCRTECKGIGMQHLRNPFCAREKRETSVYWRVEYLRLRTWSDKPVAFILATADVFSSGLGINTQQFRFGHQYSKIRHVLPPSARPSPTCTFSARPLPTCTFYSIASTSKTEIKNSISCRPPAGDRRNDMPLVFFDL